MSRPDLTKPHQETTSGGVAHAAPADQPNRVHEIAERLLEKYTVQDGQVHLAGCILDDVPVVHFQPSGGRGRGEYVYFGQANPHGRVVDQQLFETLGLGNVVPFERPPSVSPREVDRLVDAARKLVGGDGASRAAVAGTPDVCIVWCKFARGKIQFTVGEAIAQTAFAGWARTLQAPAFHCEVTGTETFRLAATSDGRIVAADEMAICPVSGQRMPRKELVRCAATGQRVAENLTARCPVTNDLVIKSHQVTCPMCQQEVSPTAISGNRCRACRGLSTIRKNDQRLARILAVYPKLANWQWLRLAETQQIYIVTASRWIDQRLIVLDRHSLEIRHAASGSRLAPGWSAVAASQYDSLLD